MKTLTYKFSTLLIILFSHYNLALSANNPPTFGTAIAESGGVDENCDLAIYVHFYLANLEQYPSNSGSQSSGHFFVPTEVTDMYLEYELEGFYSLIIDMSDVTFKYFKTINNVRLYRAILDVTPININEECSGNDIDYLDFIQRLTLWDGARHDANFYPSCQYTDEDEIFSCLVFDHTSEFCDSNPEGCDNETLSISETELRLDCNCVEVDDGGQGQGTLDGGSENRGSENNNQKYNSSNTISISPNPAIDEVNISWSNHVEIQGMVLYDLNGKIIRSWNDFNKTGFSSRILDCSDFARGIYFLKTKTSQEISVTKIIKN